MKLTEINPEKLTPHVEALREWVVKVEDEHHLTRGEVVVALLGVVAGLIVSIPSKEERYKAVDVCSLGLRNAVDSNLESFFKT